jgi:hypothetical protein
MDYRRLEIQKVVGLWRPGVGLGGWVKEIWNDVDLIGGTVIWRDPVGEQTDMNVTVAQKWPSTLPHQPTHDSRPSTITSML